MSVKNIKMTVLLDQSSSERLTALADHNSISKCAMIRQMIARLASMQIGNQPRCATGQRCPVPHMHNQEIPNGPADQMSLLSQDREGNLL